MIVYHVPRNSGMIDCYGREQPNHGRGVFRIPQMPYESAFLGDRRAPTGHLFRRHRGAHIVYVQSGGEAASRIGAEVAELLDFGELWRSLDYATITHYVDCDTAVYDLAPPPHRPGGRQRQKLSPSGTFVPVLVFTLGQAGRFPTASSCVSVRSRCRRPPGFWQTPER